MTRTPVIDIIMPYWGDVALFQECVESVRSQTRDDWRLVILDDHYPDLAAQDYIKSLDDDRITYHRHAENIGITNNFNYAIKSATAKFCVIVGCDDRLKPHYVDAAISSIGDADFYQPDVEVIDDSGNSHLPLGDKVKRVLRPKKPGLYSGQSLATSLSHGNWLYFPSIMWRTSTLKKYRFDADYKIVEDLLVEMQLILDGGTLFVADQVTFEYRRSANSLSSQEKGKNGVRFDEERQAYQHLSQMFTNAGWNKAALAAKLHVTSRVHRLLSRSGF